LHIQSGRNIWEDIMALLSSIFQAYEKRFMPLCVKKYSKNLKIRRWIYYKLECQQLRALSWKKDGPLLETIALVYELGFGHVVAFEEYLDEENNVRCNQIW